MQPAGSTNGNRANVSASIPLLFACRDKNRRRSAAFPLDTRNTRCPRAVKNTAIGNHAGPVGSITTSNTVPAGAPANAAVSTLRKLSTVGSHRRRHTSRPSSASTRAPTGPAWLPVAVFFTARGHRVFRVSRESS